MLFILWESLLLVCFASFFNSESSLYATLCIFFYLYLLMFEQLGFLVVRSDYPFHPLKEHNKNPFLVKEKS